MVAAGRQSAYFPRTYLAGLALSMDAPDHEFDSRIHVDRYECLAGMSSGPNAQQLIDEALTDVGDSAEVNLTVSKSASKPSRRRRASLRDTKVVPISNSLTTRRVLTKAWS